MLDEYLSNTDSLTCYLKYFVKDLKGKRILDYSSAKGIIQKELESLDCRVVNINDYSSGKFDGIVINNIDNNYDRVLFDNLYNLLYEEGRVLLIMHVQKSDKCFDDETEDEYISKTKETIKDKFLIKEELVSGSSWKFLIILKNTIK
ncbi:MAG: hypothetical protein J5982_03825 [Bacilli bacterium]|nr:hypothetical protein [Bacilli bacterium]